MIRASTIDCRMLLRSSSTPILSTWMPISASGSASASLPESEVLPQLMRTRSVCLTSSFDEACGRATPTRIVCDSAESNKDYPVKAKKSSRIRALPKPGKIPEKREGKEIVVFSIHNSASGAAAAAAVDGSLSVQPGGGTDVGVGGGGRRPTSPWSWLDRENTEAYYEMMINANPGNALLLANYAKFLIEVKGDLETAEEYCGRAILEDPGDSNVLSLYADLIWKTHRDAERAEAYFDQAVRTDPNDCYVLASYARFLWDAEEDGEESSSPYAAPVETPMPQHLTAAS